MIKKNLLALPLVAVLISCSASSDVEEMGLNGKVKSVFQKKYEVENRFGKWEKGDLSVDVLHVKTKFDGTGKYIESECYNYNMDMYGKIIPSRKNGKIIEEIFYDRDGKLKSKDVFHYPSKNDIIKDVFDADSNKIRCSKFILKNGKTIKMIETIINDGGEDEIYTVLYDYDIKGNLIYERASNKNGETVDDYKFEYLEFDIKGNWTKKIAYKDTGVPEYMLIRNIEYYE